MKRARVEHLSINAEDVSIRFATPEDTLLHKLIWYKLGNEISDRQWSDILGVLRVQGDALRLQLKPRSLERLGNG
jgi:hypothetical protein